MKTAVSLMTAGLGAVGLVALVLAGLAALVSVPGAPARAQSSSTSQGQSLEDVPSAFRGPGRRASWHADVVRTERGHLIGNPAAEAQLIVFLSYSSPESFAWLREGEGALDLALLAPGHMSVEIRPVIENALDLTVALLAGCGEASGFKDRHRLYLATQERWLEAARRSPRRTEMFTMRSERYIRTRIANSLNFDDMLANRGASRLDINACLSDNEAARALIANGQADAREFGSLSSPSFALDGERLEGVHDWATLYPLLAERFRPAPEE